VVAREHVYNSLSSMEWLKSDSSWVQNDSIHRSQAACNEGRCGPASNVCLDDATYWNAEDPDSPQWVGFYKIHAHKIDNQ